MSCTHSSTVPPERGREGADAPAVRAWLRAWQDRLCAVLERLDGRSRFVEETWEMPLGAGRTRVMQDGAVFEKAGVGYSEVRGPSLPASATERHPDLAGRPWTAAGVSLVLHPQNPYVPATHANLRLFTAGESWWFGGGFDLSPVYAFAEDAIHWHRTASAALAPFGADVYERFKRACDEYFFLPHRGEARGVGGVFFDDFSEGGFERCFALVQAVGGAFPAAYEPIVLRRRNMPWGERERAFQLHRRARYAEFNLVWDRGTRFGLQSGARADSLLMSLPPLAAWRHGWRPEPGSPEERLAEFLRPRDWASESAS